MAIVLILVTSPNDETAVRLAEGALDAGLAACILRSDVNSMYNWQGEKCQENESWSPSESGLSKEKF